MSIQCPKCSNEAEALLKVESGMKLRLQEIGNSAQQLNEVCDTCYKSLMKEVDQGAKLMAEQNQKEHNRKMLWKNRVGFVKEGRERMGVRSFSEAAVLYEKYLRALEIVHDFPPGKLDPLVFNAPGKSSELTILISVYWDLFKIYDSSDKYKDRQASVANHLLSILPYCNVQTDFLKRLERFARDAKHPDTAKDLLNKARQATGAGGCYIATAAFGSEFEPSVSHLRYFRDYYLLEQNIGRKLVRAYYLSAPPVAKWISTKPIAKKIIRKILTPIAMHIASRYNLPK
ncbi:MAG: CFI-box-CTERM domain-containing protein [Bdellovibrionales bacterium]